MGTPPRGLAVFCVNRRASWARAFAKVLVQEDFTSCASCVFCGGSVELLGAVFFVQVDRAIIHE